MPFDLFDPSGPVRITTGHLPHWFQPGVTYFITFRTDDSIPASLAESWQRRREEWLDFHGVRIADPEWKRHFACLPIDLQAEFHRTFSREFMAYLDQGMGECVLRQPEMSRIVADALLHFDHSRYEMGDFIVMPNHVHLLVCLKHDTDVEAQCYSWKKYSAGRINNRLGRRGRFWQEESFDHLVRSAEQFTALRRYITDNPRKNGLKAGEYFHYVRKDP